MTKSLPSKAFALFLALAMLFIFAAPAGAAKSKHRRKHGKRVAANHHAPKHRQSNKHA